MINETKGFLSLGYWNRQKELLDEAHSLHRANRAVREAKDAAAAHGARAHADKGANARGADPTSHRSTPRRTGRPPVANKRPVPAWRSAAARMGSSLVAVGERLERLAPSRTRPS